VLLFDMLCSLAIFGVRDLNLVAQGIEDPFERVLDTSLLSSYISTVRSSSIDR
jgi:hypothetical protein